MIFFQSLAIAAVAWMLTVGILVYLLFKEQLPSEASNMVVYLILQAAVPTFVFWWFNCVYFV